MYDRIFSQGDLFSVGEMPIAVNEAQASQYVAKERRELDMIFHFNHINFDNTNGDKWKIRNWELPELEEKLRAWQQHMLGNHGIFLLSRELFNSN